MKDQAITRALSIAKRKRQHGGGTWEDALPEPSTNVEDRRGLGRQTAIRDKRWEAVVGQASGANIREAIRGSGGKDVRDLINAMPSTASRRAYGGSAGMGVPKPPKVPGFGGGFINSAVPGRTDKLNMTVPSGSYVVPSSVVSHLGQDNSLAGAHVLDAMFDASNPQGSAAPKIRSKRAFRSGRARIGTRKAKYAEGGMVEEEVPVVVAGGEWVATPEMLTAKFGDDLDRAHKIMDSFVEQARAKHIKTLRKLPGPVK